MEDKEFRKFLENTNIFDLQGLADIRNRPDLLGHIRFDVTPKVIMAPRLGGGETRDVAGLFFYIEAFDPPPTVMLMKVGQLGVMNTVGRIEEVPQELVERAVATPAEPPANNMYAISDEIRDWIKEQLGIS